MTTSSELKVNEAAKYLGIHSETLRKYIAMGRVTPLPGRPCRFDMPYLKQLKTAPGLCKRQDAMARLGVKTVDRMQRMEKCGLLTRITHPLYGPCYPRKELEKLMGPTEWGGLLSSQEAARYVKVSSSTLRRWRQEGKVMPAKTTPAGRHLYKKSDLDHLRISKSEELLKGPEARTMLGLNKAKMRSAVARGDVRIIKTPGGRWRYPLQALLAYQQKLLASA